MDNSINYRLTLKDFFSKGIKNATGQVKTLDGSMSKLENTASRVGKGIAAYFTFGAIKDFGMQVLESLKNYEYFSASLRTLMYGDKVAAKALEGQLVKLAATTPFSLVDVQKNTKLLMAYGIEANKIIPTMKMLGDVSAALGEGAFEQISLAFGQIKSKGHLAGQELLQLTNAGFNPLKVMVKKTGNTYEELTKKMEKGLISFSMVEDAFKEVTKEGGQFYGMMNEQMNTVGGRLSTLGDSWEQLKVNIGKSQRGIIANTISWSNALVGSIGEVIAQSNRLDEAFKDAGIKQRSLFRGMMETLSPIMRVLTGGLYGGHSKYELIDSGIQEIVAKSAKDNVENLRAKSSLLTMQSDYSKKFANKKIGKKEYQEVSALLQGALKQVAGNAKLLTAPVNRDAAKQGLEDIDKKTGSSASIGSSTEIHGARPQNINITVGKLADITIETTNITEAPAQVKAQLDKALLELLNDANLIASR